MGQWDGDGEEARWAKQIEAVVGGVRAWRAAHPRATVREIAAAVDAEMNGLRAQMLAGAATWRPELERFKALCPQLMLGQAVGAGHFNMLEVPDQVNAMIERFLALNDLGRGQ